MTTKDKIESIKLEIRLRQLHGCSGMGDGGRAMLAQVYADVMRRHPWAVFKRNLPRLVRAVHRMAGL